MGKRDYTKFANTHEKFKTEELQNGVAEVVETPVEEVKVEKIGVVENCTMLNVRKDPDTEADVVCVLTAQSEVTVNDEESTPDFYKVCTAAGAEGFCMKKFIRIK